METNVIYVIYNYVDYNVLIVYQDKQILHLNHQL